MDRREFHGTTLAALAAGLGGPGEPAVPPVPKPTDINPPDVPPPGASVRLGNTRFNHLVEGGNGGLCGLAFSPDGTVLAALGLQDHHVSLWAIPSGRLIRKWADNPADRSGGLTFSPDGRLLAVCGFGVRVWNLGTGQRLWAVEEQYSTVPAVAFTPDGRFVLTADQFPRTVTAYDAVGGRAVHTYESAPRPASPAPDSDWWHAVAVSPDGQWVAAGGASVWVWKTGKSRPHAKLTGQHTAPVVRLGFGPSNRVVTVGENGATHAWDPYTGTHLRCLVASPSLRSGPSVFPMPGGRELLVGREGGSSLLDAMTGDGRPSDRLPPWTEWSHIAASTDGRWLAATMYSDQFRVWDRQAGRPCHPPGRHAGWIDGVAFTADGRRAVTASRTDVLTWDAAGGLLAEYRPDGYLRPETLAVSPAGPLAACGLNQNAGQEGAICVWNYETGRGRQLPTAGPVHALTWTADGRGLVLATGDGRVRVHPVHRDGPPLELEPTEQRAVHLTVSGDGRFIAALASLAWFDDVLTVHLWDARTGRRAGCSLAPPLPPDQPPAWRTPIDLRFAPDGRSLALGVWNAAVCVGPVADFLDQRLSPYAWREVHTVGTLALGYTPAGRLLAAESCGTDDDIGYGPYEIRVWDVDTGQEVWCSPPVRHVVSALAFSPDGRRLLAGSWDTTALVWEW